MALPIKLHRLEELVMQNGEKKTPGASVDARDPEKSMFYHGFSSIKQEHYGKNPLEASERTYRARQEYTDLVLLRKVQGLHAPLRLIMERKAAAKVGHLPFLPRSNFSEEILDGRYETILPEDVLGNPREFPSVHLPPHMTMERQLGIL